MAPAAVLARRGPVVQVSVTVGQAIAEQLLQRGEAVPEPVAGLALIDTGASVTCIDEPTALAMGLVAIDVASMASASEASSERGVYPIAVEITAVPLRIDAPRSVGAALASQGLLLLIGRDVLRNCLLVYNGSTGQFSLAV